VLAAMRRALAAGGYDAVTIEGLAAEAEVSKQTIYRWWPNKAAILGEALLDGGELPGPGPRVPESGDFAADLRAWFTEMSAELGRGAGLEIARALIAVTATDAPLGTALNERFAGPILGWVTDRIERAKADGAVRADVDPAVIADQFVAQASYAALLGRPLDAARIDATVDVLLRGIQP